MSQLKLTEIVPKWFAKHRNVRSVTSVISRLDRLAFGHTDDVMPIVNGTVDRFHDGPGYRIYFHRHVNTIIVLLCGNDKSSRACDLETVLKLTDDIEKIAKTEKLTDFDPAEHLNSDQTIADFMTAAFETEDPAYVAHALGIVAQAKGMMEIANQAGLPHEQLYQSFSAQGNPTLRTTLALMKAFGIKLSAKQTAS